MVTQKSFKTGRNEPVIISDIWIFAIKSTEAWHDSLSMSHNHGPVSGVNARWFTAWGPAMLWSVIHARTLWVNLSCSKPPDEFHPRKRGPRITQPPSPALTPFRAESPLYEAPDKYTIEIYCTLRIWKEFLCFMLPPGGHTLGNRYRHSEGSTFWYSYCFAV